MLAELNNQFQITRRSLKHNGRQTETVTIAVSSDRVSSIRHKLVRMKRQENFARDHNKNFQSLSIRERQILKQLAQGLSSFEVGRNLYISVETVKQHRKNIHRKLEVTSMNGLIDYILAFNLI